MLVRTMKSFILITAFLLYSFSWASVSVSESQTVEVQPGDEVTLHCSNISRTPTHIFWSRLVDRTKINCISSMNGLNGHAQFCDGFQNDRFNMSSNISTVFLKITQVEISDSGLYMCGFYLNGNTELKGIHLNIQGYDECNDDVVNIYKKKFYKQTQLMSLILSGLTLFLLMVIIGLVVKIMKLQTASDEEQTTPHSEICQMSDCQDFNMQNLESDNLNYAALSFKPKPKRNRRPVSEDPNVIYATTK